MCTTCGFSDTGGVTVSSQREVNPGIEVLEVSATRGDGMEDWYGWLQAQRAELGVGAGA